MFRPQPDPNAVYLGPNPVIFRQICVPNINKAYPVIKKPKTKAELLMDLLDELIDQYDCVERCETHLL